MGAFDGPFSDIDRTRSGQPYVVDSSGYGWFTIFIFACVPFFLLSLFLFRVASAISQHPVMTAAIYSVVAVIVAYVLYSDKGKPNRVVGIVAAILTMLPFAAVQAGYAIPHILTTDGFFVVAFEWLLVTLVMVGLTVFVELIGVTVENSYVHLLLACALIVIVAIILKPPGELSWDDVKQLYQTTA